MTNFIRISIILVFSYLVATLPAVGDDLIEPTRALEGVWEKPAKLTVFSEPPQLDVYLDDEEIGQTPLWLDNVRSGTYELRIGVSETEIYIGEGKELRIGIFKGSFVKSIHEALETPPVEPKTPVQVDRIEKPQEKRRRDLTRWEKFINGSLPHF